MFVRSFNEESDNNAIDALVGGDSGLSEAKYVDLGRGARRRGAGVVGVIHGRVVGYAHGLPIAERNVWAVEAVIDDAHRIAANYDHLIRGAIAAIPKEVEVRVWSKHPAHTDAATRAGYESIRELRRLGRSLPPDSKPEFPTGVDVRAFRMGTDEEAWMAANNAAFAHHPENQGWNLTRLKDTMSLPWFDAAGLLMAWEGDDLLGSCWTKVHDSGVGEIYIIGVDPRHHGRGLGRALSLAGLWHLSDDRGLQKVMLYTDSGNEAGNTVYEQLGFTIQETTTEFRARPQPGGRPVGCP